MRYQKKASQQVGVLTEIKKDFAAVKKYIFYFISIAGILSFLIYYNTLHIQKDRNIAQLTQEKNLLIVENLKLQKEITVLSSPKRIETIAKEKLKMVPVSYESVKFLEVDE